MSLSRTGLAHGIYNESLEKSCKLEVKKSYLDFFLLGVGVYLESNPFGGIEFLSGETTPHYVSHDKARSNRWCHDETRSNRWCHNKARSNRWTHLDSCADEASWEEQSRVQATKRSLARRKSKLLDRGYETGPMDSTPVQFIIEVLAFCHFII